MREMRESPLEAGIGCLTRLLGTYVLVIALIVYAGAKHHNKDTAPTNSTSTTIENELPEQFIVLAYNDIVVPVNYESYNSFKNSGDPGMILVDTMGEEKTQIYVEKEDIQELGIFSSYSEAADYISGLGNPKTRG